MQPRHRQTGPLDGPAAAARRVGSRLHRTGQRAWLRWRAYDERLDRDPERRERSAMLVVGAVAVVVVLGMIVLLVVASGGNRSPARAARPVPTTSAATPTPSPTTASPTPTATPTASPTPTVPAGGTFRALHSGRCLAVRGDSRRTGARLVQRTCDAGPGEGFHLVPAGAAGAYQLIDALSGQCVDVSDGSAADGARVIQWDCHGGPNQQFTLRDVPGLPGSLQLVAVHSGKCLDVTGVSTEDGATVQQWTCHSPGEEATMRNQSWVLSG